MARTIRNSVLVAVCLGVALAWTSASATPGTNLNDIPIAKVLPWRSFELSTWVTTGEGEEPAWWGDVNIGVLNYGEVGLYAMLGPRDNGQGDARFFGKFVYPIGEKLPSVGVGLLNLTNNEDENGNVDPYLVVMQDFGPVRGHLGYSFQDGDEAFFAGVDTSFSFLEQATTVGLDATQTNDGDDWLVSAGFEYALPLNFVVEGWYTWTTVEDAANTITLRLNWVTSF
jgi:hypothetical protein